MPPEQSREPEQEPVESAPDVAGDQSAAPPQGRPVTLSHAEYEELKTLAQERDDYLRRLQRAVADYQNLQKRMEKFRESAHEATLRSLAEAILPVADSLARALEAAGQTAGAERIVEGLHLGEKEFYGALQKFGITPIKAEGEKFDPHFHEAVMQQPAADAEPNTVLRELKKGFLMGQQVLRPSQVVVAVAPPEDESGQKSEAPA